MRAAVLLAFFALVGCASGPAKNIQAGNAVVYDFTQRTDRLCTGTTPVLSKAECLDRIATAERAQKALTAARVALAGCPPAPAECKAGAIALAALEEVLRQLEGYAYKGAK